MIIRKLDWDSDFFGLRIGRADLQSREDAVELAAMKDELQKEFDLLYVFDEQHVGFVAVGAKLVDEKVLYRKPCEQKSACDGVLMYDGCKPSEDLYHLAQVSGGFSRFKLDERFEPGSFEKMYDRWIENACPQEGTNRQIFVFCPDGVAKGMISVDHHDGLAHIGLVAVDPDYQNSGIGLRLMSSMEEYLYRLGVVSSIEVPTQRTNVPACRWYEKNGFTIVNVTNIYHWWL